MDDGHFDEVARSLAGGGETRRGLLRLVAGGVLGGATARLGLAVAAEAKPGKHRRRQGAAKRHVALQAEGKRKKKRRKNPPKPQLCDPLCAEDGGRCCAGAGCVFDEQCCPGEKPCDDGSCVGLRDCCPGEDPCRDGSCPAPGKCCPDLYQCGDGSCIDPLDQCCPEQRRCGNGECIPRDACCADDTPLVCDGQCGEEVCEDGEVVCRPRRNGEPCSGPGTACCNGRCYTITGCGEGRHFNTDNCRCECDVVQACPPGQGFSHSTCSCVCNCVGLCCLSGCCKHPGPFGSNYCCLGY